MPVLTWLVLTASASEVPATGASPEPVLELAKADVRATHRAQIGLVLATVGAPIAVAGTAGLVTYADRSSEVGYGLSIGMTAGGVGSVLAGPPLLAVSALRARNQLVAQGLDVRATPGRLSLALYAATGVYAVASGSLGPIASLGTVAVYAGAVVAGGLQLVENQRARRRAGWLGAAPWTDAHAGGVVVALAR